MTAVFSHGRLRLYLLKLLAEGPKHGYELIRLLENRFLGLYAPSAGTIYPRLARLEAEGLVTHSAVGGRKVYEITDAGRAELTARADELTDLETEIHASVADLATLANEIELQVSGSVRDIKRELRDAAHAARTPSWRAARPPWSAGGNDTFPGYAGRGTGTAAGSGRTAETSAAAEDFDRTVTGFAAEVRRLAARAGIGDPELRAATAVISSALTELRRLLR